MVLEPVLDGLPHLVWQTDSEGNLLFTNASWREYTGLAKGGSTPFTLSAMWDNLLHPEDLAGAHASWSQHSRDRTPSLMECRIRKASDGEYYWHKINSYFVEQLACSMSMAVDTHQEKIALHSLHEHEQQERLFSQIINTVVDPIVVFDSDGTIVTFNHGAERAFQYPSNDVVGKSFNILLSDAFQEDSQGLLAGYATVAVPSQLVRMSDSFVNRQDGTKLPVTLFLGDFVEDGRRLYVAKLNTPDLSVQQSKDNFLSTVSHELRTPLFGLLGTISVMQSTLDLTTPSGQFDLPSGDPVLPLDNCDSDRSAPTDDPNLPANEITELSNDLDLRLKDLGLRLNNQSPLDRNSRLSNNATHAELRQMEVCARSLLCVVDNLIDHYKLEHLPYTPLAVPFQPHSLLAEVCCNFSSCVADGVEFVYVVREGVPPALAVDTTLLRHVLANLVSNALRFTSKGKVEVVLDIQALEKEEQSLYVSVTDTGTGIPRDFFPRIFHPFSQMDGCNNRQYGGVGLGLAVCKRMVDLMNGTITFDSTPGIGSVFEISVPVSPMPIQPLASLEQAAGEQTEPANEEPLNSDRTYSSLEDFFEDNVSITSSPELPTNFLESFTRSRMGNLYSIPEDSLPQSPQCLPLFDPRSTPPISSSSQVRRPASSSAPPSPRKVALSPPLIPMFSHFFRRPSFPFILDDPTVSMMLLPSSPSMLTNPSATTRSPEQSPRQSPRSPPISPPPHPISRSLSMTSSSSSISLSLHIRVLVVEDNLVNQNVIKKMLRRMECIVVIAHNGKDALDILFESNNPNYYGYHNFDLILMDCQMPVMDGFQATKKIREWELQNDKPPIKIVALTANGSSENEKQCYETGMDSFIGKPITLQGLRHVLLPSKELLAAATFL